MKLIFVVIISCFSHSFSVVRPKSLTMLVNSDYSGCIENPIYPNETIQILDCQKKYDSTSSFLNKFSTQCHTWKLSYDDILQIIQNREHEDVFDIHNHYNVLPCSYEGHILLKNQKYFFTINAGSFIILSRNKNDIYYICPNKKLKHLFVTGRFER